MDVLIVDDNDLMLCVLQRMLTRLGHRVIIAHNGREALDQITTQAIHLVITDWEMPEMDGVELCRAIRSTDMSGYVYVIMLTAHEGPKARVEGLNAGADDFLSKPVDNDELIARLKTAMRILSLETRDVALFALAKLAESRDPETGAHVDRVQGYARIIARHLSDEVKQRAGVDENFIRLLYQTSPLHDLGKVSIPDNILLKPGKLTSTEYEIMKTHASLGAKTLGAALIRFPNAQFLQMARDVAASHHEHFDGTGYPAGLAGEEIPLCGRIVALADVYDALTSRRVYKAATSHEQAKEIILKDRGGHFDPEVVDAFLRAEPQILEIHAEFRDASAEASTASKDDGKTPSGRFEFRAEKILVVEDDPVVRRKLVELLSETNACILTAQDIKEAMTLFARECPQLVISDWEMPGGNGSELCRLIRQQFAVSPVHFIMLTVRTDQDSLLDAYDAGVNDFITKPFHPHELLARVRAGLRTSKLHDELLRKSAEMQSINAQLITMNTRLDKLSVTDELTGLSNRRRAMNFLEQIWKFPEQPDRPLTVAMLDIDHFKNINDRYGHKAGDTILRSVAALLRNQVREVDLVCRVGGEEFLIILPGQSLAEGTLCAERCRSAIEQRIHLIEGEEIRVTVSVGVAFRTTDKLQMSDLLKSADQSLYAAKHDGRNVVRADCSRPVTKNSVSTEPPATARAAGQPPVDFGVVSRRCGDDAEFTTAVIDRFCAQAGNEVDILFKALEGKQIDSLRRSAHNLKSMTGYLSADAASQLSTQIEQLARADEFTGVSALADKLRAEVDHILSWLGENHYAPSDAAPTSEVLPCPKS